MAEDPRDVRGDPREIVADPRQVPPSVEESRGSVDTVDKLQQRLRAEHTRDDMQHDSRPASWGGGVMEMIREHPVPAALAAVGLGWLLTRRSS